MTTLVDAAKDITKVLLSQEGVSEYDIMEYLLLGLIRFDFIPTENRTKQYKHKKAKRTSPQQQSTTTNVNSIKTIHGAVSEQQTSQTIDQSYNLNMLKSRSNIESNLNRGKRLIINLERIATTKLKKEDLTDEHLNALQASSKSNNDELVEDVNKIIDPVTSELTKEDLTDEHLNTLQASSKSNNDELVEDVDKIIDPVTSEITKEDLTDEHLNTLQASSKSNNDELVEDVDKIIDPVTSEITKEDLTDEHLNALQASSKSNNDESHEKKKKIDPDKYNSQNSSSEPSTDDKIKWLTQECQVARESFLKAAEGFRNTSATMTCFPEFQILCCCHPSLFLDMCSNFMDELDDQLDKCFKAYQQVNEKSDELLYLETSKHADNEKVPFLVIIHKLFTEIFELSEITTDYKYVEMESLYSKLWVLQHDKGAYMHKSIYLTLRHQSLDKILEHCVRFQKYDDLSKAASELHVVKSNLDAE
ncbi:hypothetical protein TKK_0007997 [Trichogramma kaykai]